MLSHVNYQLAGQFRRFRPGDENRFPELAAESPLPDGHPAKNQTIDW